MAKPIVDFILTTFFSSNSKSFAKEGPNVFRLPLPLHIAATQTQQQFHLWFTC